VQDKPCKKTAKQHEAIALLKGDARHVMLYGGSRSGKTFILLYALIVRALKTKSRHLILRLHFNHVKTSVWHDTLPKVIELICPDLPITWNRSDYFISFPNGSEIWIGGLDDKERTEKVLGTEYSTILFNECSQITYESVITARSRLAEKSGLVNRAYYDCNPPHKQHWAHRVFIEGVDPKDKTPLPRLERYASMLMNPIDNIENIAPEFMEELQGFPRRKRERFLLGLWLDIGEGSLWKYDDIRRETNPPEMERIVVAVDPAVTATAKSDATGIIVAGRCGNRFYVLEDVSGRYTPKAWAGRAVNAYYKWKADRVIAEVNNGGDLVELTLRQISESVPYKEVRASRGKAVRAEPVAALYEGGRGFHCGVFPDLEDQMVTLGSGEEILDDRVDALVWAATELMLKDKPVLDMYVVEL